MKSQPHASQQIAALLQFIHRSPTAFHCVEACKEILEETGYQQLHYRVPSLEPAAGYYTTRDGSSLIAFETPITTPRKMVLIASHTDSPSLKLKPNPLYATPEGLQMACCEVYGSPILSSYFNRELSIAGRIVVSKEGGPLEQRLIYKENPLAIIPHLAIHLERNLLDEVKIDKQKHLNALVGHAAAGKKLTLEKLMNCSADEAILGHDLYFVAHEAPRLTGVNGEYISSPRLDNLLAVYSSLQALCYTPPCDSTLKVMVSWDHEEVGSLSQKGADSAYLSGFFEQIRELYGMSIGQWQQLVSDSLLVSNDAAHALHPNYPEKHDACNAPRLCAGVALKHNANMRYTTNALGAALIQQLCNQRRIALQHFAGNNEQRCGSTVGPMASAHTGLPCVDIGIPLLSMHSIREVAACSDYQAMTELHYAFYEQFL